MTSVWEDLAHSHPQPIVWTDVPVSKRIAITKVAGRLQDAGFYHNAYINIFNGEQIPPNRMYTVTLDKGDPDAVKVLMKEVDAYQTVIVHIEKDRKHGRPAVLTLSSIWGTVLAIDLYQGDNPKPLEAMRRHHPELHRALTDRNIARLTPSYDTTTAFLARHLNPNLVRDVVDLVLVGSLLRKRDFASLFSYENLTETLSLQVLVWSVLGQQQGPVPSKATWREEVKAPDTPWDEARRHLLRFKRGQPRSAAQNKWLYQVARAASAITIHGSEQFIY